MSCANCGEELPALARSNRRYCNDRCRRRAHERRHQPQPELAPVVPITDTNGLTEAVERATEETRLDAIVAAEARRSWRAAAWVLERRYPERWASIRRRPPEELELAVVGDGDDPFREVDELAARRSPTENARPLAQTGASRVQGMGAVELTVVRNEMEAEVICGLLREHGIECGYRKSDMAGAWTVGFASGGPTQVLVDETKIDKARKLLPADKQD